MAITKGTKPPRLAVAATLIFAVVLPALPAKGSPVIPPYPPLATVAIIDTGINPYHLVFRDTSPRAYQHPSTYIEGFPKDAEALRISLNENDYLTALYKDCDLWNSVERGKLYWFPGTKIVGAITFDEIRTELDCADRQLPAGRILDAGGHGTMTASRAVASGYGACPDCRVIAVQGFTTASVQWAGDNSDWIDIQSNSWGPILPAWSPAPGNNIINDPEFVRTVEDTAQRHLSFWASGNGAATRGGVLGHPTLIDPRMTPSIVMVGGHDSGYVNLWPDFPPHVVSDSCNSWAAYHTETEKSAEDVGGGTSGASPFAAGGAARILMEARRLLGDDGSGVDEGVIAEGRAPSSKGPLADGELTLEELKDLVFKTATERPTAQREDGPVCDPISGLVISSATPVKWEDVPEEYPEYIHIGYGAVDRPSVQRAFRVLAGKQKMPDRAETDAYFELDSGVRSELHQIFRN